MRINKLVLENYRGFEGVQELEFPKGSVTAILGINGAGKTSVLNAVGLVLKGVLRRYARSIGDELSYTDYDVTIGKGKSNIQGLFQEESISSGPISVTNYSHSLYADKAGFSFVDALGYKFMKPKENISIVIYYQTNRSFSGDGIEQYDILSKPIDRGMVYQNAFNPIINYNQILNWYLQQINIQNSEKVKRKDLNYELPTMTAITSAINNFLKNLEGTSLRNATIEVSQYNSNQVLVISKDGNDLEFSQLSAGEKMVIGMVLDIAYRMSVANPFLKNPLETDGIIMIDELELHLHPKWQMSILKALNQTFANIQFIVTTHSPLIINQLKSEELILLDNFKILQGETIHNTYGRDINSIIDDFMGASSRPKEVKKLFREIENLLDLEKPDTVSAREKLNKLKAIVDPNDYEIVKLETLIALEEDEANY